MTLSRAELAARNNAVWCDTLCRAHGAPGEFTGAVWLNRHRVPPFHSNAVTYRELRGDDARREQLAAMFEAGLPPGWGFKDSFRALDVAELGFAVAFEATWIWREPAPASLGAGRARWTLVHGEEELAAWESAWAGGTAGSPGGPRRRQFPPALLDDPAVAFVARRRGDAMVAGGIVNHTGDVAGLSNVFGPPDERAATWAGCVAMAQERFPGLPLVGYDRGEELAAAEAAGFQRLQDLRVWWRPPA